jgi:hypothetical protein
MANDNKFEYIIEFIKQGNTDAAVKEMEKLQKAGEHSSGAMEKLTKAGEQVLAFYAVEFTLKKAVEEFLSAERAATKLETALRGSGQATEEYRKAIQNIITDLKEATLFTGTEITNVVAKLVALKAPKEYLADLTERTLDLSTLMDKDLNKAISAMASALRGDFTIFKDLGFVFDDNTTAAQKFDSMLQQLSRTAGGQAKAAAESLGGQFEKTKKEVDEFAEVLGHKLVESLAAVNTGLQQIVKATHWQEEMKQIGDLQRQYERLADSIGKLIVAKKANGEISFAQAVDMISDLQRVRTVLGSEAAGGSSVDSAARSNALNRVLPSARGALDDMMKRLGAPGFGTEKTTGAAATGPGPAFDAERQEAIKELDKLQKQYNADTLTGYDRERAVVAENYIAQMEQINLLANRAGSSIQEREELEQEADKAREQRLYEITRKEEAENSKRAEEEYKNAKEITDAEMELRNEAASMQLQGMEAQMFQVEADHEKRKRMISELKFADEDRYIEMMALEEQLHQAQLKRVQDEKNFSELMKKDLHDIEVQGVQAFSQGLAGAMIDAFEEGDKAFQKFASNFLRQIAQMILQSLILNSLKSIGLGLSGGGLVSANAAGGVHFAAAGMMGMSSGPTFFPKFNTIAGEAGREMLAVLARPNSVSLRNGVAAQFGTVRGQEMALVGGRALRQMSGEGGAGGQVAITVTLGPGLEASIVNKASNVAVQKVTSDMGSHTALSEATKRLVA